MIYTYITLKHRVIHLQGALILYQFDLPENYQCRFPTHYAKFVLQETLPKFRKRPEVFFTINENFEKQKEILF